MGRAWMAAAGWTGGARYESKLKENLSAVLRIRNVCPGSRIWFFHPESWIQIRNTESTMN
jgi:hypothetical protein